MDNNEKNTLSHIGIMGMKWGHTKGSGWASKPTSKKTTTNVATTKAKTTNSEDYINAKKLKKKSMNSLTNAQLRTANERIQLERTYKQLNPAAVSKGQKFVLGLLGNSAKAIAGVYVTKYMGKGGAQLEKLITSQLSKHRNLPALI